MNGKQMRKRWERRAFMRETLQRNIWKAKLDGNAGLAINYELALRKYAVEWRSQHPENDNRSFRGLIASLKIKAAVASVINRRKAAKAARRINRRKK